MNGLGWFITGFFTSLILIAVLVAAINRTPHRSGR